MTIDDPIFNKVIAILEDLIFFGEMLIAYGYMIRFTKSIIHLAIVTKCQIITLHCEVVKEGLARIVFVPMIVRTVFCGVWWILSVEGMTERSNPTTSFLLVILFAEISNFVQQLFHILCQAIYFAFDWSSIFPYMVVYTKSFMVNSMYLIKFLTIITILSNSLDIVSILIECGINAIGRMALFG